MGANQSSIQTPDENALTESLEGHSQLNGFVVDTALIPGSGRFTRTHRIKHKTVQSTAVVKSLWIAEDTAIDDYRDELVRIKSALQGQSHVAPFLAWFIGEARRPQLYRPVFLLRSHLYTTLSDRLASRPWLDSIEKFWIASQLLDALQHVHSANVVHGFLTTENIGLTSHGWVVLTDFASHKSNQPLPDDDPSAYMYFFHPQDGSNVREKRCYLAPERFYMVSGTPPTEIKITPASDMFSTGCLLAELFLNGERCMDLGDVMEYRKLGSMPPSLLQKLNKIESSHIRATCRNMLRLDPAERLDAATYSERMQETEQWPKSLGMLSKIAERMTKSCYTQDAKLAVLVSQYRTVLWETVGVRDTVGERYISAVLGESTMKQEAPDAVDASFFDKKPKEELPEIDLFAEAESLLEQLETMDFEDEDSVNNPRASVSTENPREERSDATKNSILIYLQTILSSVRSVQRPSSKLVALTLIRRVSEYVGDGARLQRIVPVVVSLLEDSDSIVRGLALQTLTSTLECVTSFPPSDSKIFPEYIFKRLSSMGSDTCLNVRVVFAECLAVIAETARRFLDISHAVRLYEAAGDGADSGADNGSEMPKVFDDKATRLLDDETSKSSEASGAGNGKVLINSTYDSDLEGLQEVVSRWVFHIATDQSEFSSFPKRSLLRNLDKLCLFFGLDGVMSFILPQMLTFLNDRKDWELRAALFQNLPALCGTIGRASTEEFVLPCVEIGLVDEQEKVIAEALCCLRKLTEIRLLSRTALLGGSPTAKADPSSIVKRYAPLLLHPSSNVRIQASETYAAILCCLSESDVNVYMVPTLLPFMRYHPSADQMVSAKGLESCLQEPWERSVFERELVSIRLHDANRDAWTSIEGDVTDNSRETRSKEHPTKQKYLQTYIRMLWKQNAQSTSTRGRPVSSLAQGIEGSAKLAQSVMFPRQGAVGAQDRVLPEWFSVGQYSNGDYVGRRQAYAQIRSVSQIGHVFGLSIMGHTQEPTTISPEPSSMLEGEYPDSVNTSNLSMIEASHRGEWGAEVLLSPSCVDTSMLVTKLEGLGVPPLPPNLGGRLAPGLGYRPTPGRKQAKGWKPRMSALVGSSTTVEGHARPVSRLAVSLDSSFFASGSFDGTCRIWKTTQAEQSNGILKSECIYSGHSENSRARVNDIAMVEGSNSIVSGDNNGQVHVWRVDLGEEDPGGEANGQRDSYSVGIIGTTSLRREEVNEGEVLAVSHFGSPSGSTIVYATQKGRIHSWDLRCAERPFILEHSPGLGLLSSMSLGHDRNYIVTGTSRGYLGLWDIRFNRAVKLWKHSSGFPVNRVATSFVSPPHTWGKPSTDSLFTPFLFVACGPNETSMYDMTNGNCKQSFQVGENNPRSDSVGALSPLWDVPIGPDDRGVLSSGRMDNLSEPAPLTSVKPTINALVGSIGASDESFLITGGSDSRVRFWDFADPAKCCSMGGSTIRGKARYERKDFDNGEARRLTCWEVDAPSTSVSRGFSRKINQGLRRPDEHHSDSINDVKLLGTNLMITCSRDSTVKVWR